MIPIWTLNSDGSFDLAAGSLRLSRAYPAFDFRSLRVDKVEMERTANGGTIVYRMAGGSVRITLGADADGVFLDSSLEGFEKAPHWFHPIAEAQVEGATRLFRQGIGFSGPTNFVALPASGELLSYDSYLVTGLVAADQATLALGALDHKIFLHKCITYNRVDRRTFRNREVAQNLYFFESGFSTELLALEGKPLHLPRITIAVAPTTWEAARTVAQRIGDANHARVGTPSYHWCSWYHRSSHLTLDELVSFLDGAKKQNEPLMAVQIDDGYCTSQGDWLDENTKWPGGLKKAFAEIKQRGYRPGIWIAPYMVESRSKLYTDHPDWVLKGLDGKPIVTWKRYNESSSKSEEYHILDTSHPDAFAYLRHVFSTFRAWGAEVYKTDFVEWGYRDSTTVQRHTPGKTSAQYHNDVIRMIRECIGEDSFWLGCIAFFGPYIGYVDSMRMTSDVSADWGELKPSVNGPEGGTGNVVYETYNTLYLNNTLFQNDPDALYLRDYHISMDEQEIQALALFFGILGVSINTSDRIAEMPANRQRLWRFIRPQRTPWTAALPRFGKEDVLHTAVRHYPQTGGHAFLVLNPTKAPILAHYSVQELIGQASVTAYTWGIDGATKLGEKSEFTLTVSGHQAQLFYLSTTGAPPPAELTLGGYGV
ncbi:MAG: glycoside hydrolase family 36 protein [Verrucomicrobiota bacterium]|nr:glycoside hydrolase family 36 protein [Verrucomicrobiota bacterium]